MVAEPLALASRRAIRSRAGSEAAHFQNTSAALAWHKAAAMKSGILEPNRRKQKAAISGPTSPGMLAIGFMTLSIMAASGPPLVLLFDSKP